jgi:hypothetical protein
VRGSDVSAPLFRQPRYLEPRYREAKDYVSIAIPYWLPGLFVLALPMWWMGEIMRKRRRATHGLCPTCGYDIRASRERCPECGSATPAH